MLGEIEATVAEARPFDLHGVTYHDLTLVYVDGATETARLGPEAVPEGLSEGEKVLAMRAANMVVSVRRP
jgi:hypothetical protein